MKYVSRVTKKSAARATGLKVSCPVALDRLSNSVETKKTQKNQDGGRTVSINVFSAEIQFF